MQGSDVDYSFKPSSANPWSDCSKMVESERVSRSGMAKSFSCVIVALQEPIVLNLCWNFVVPFDTSGLQLLEETLQHKRYQRNPSLVVKEPS